MVCLMFTQPARIHSLRLHNSPSQKMQKNMFGCRSAVLTCSGSGCGLQVLESLVPGHTTVLLEPIVNRIMLDTG